MPIIEFYALKIAIYAANYAGLHKFRYEDIQKLKADFIYEMRCKCPVLCRPIQCVRAKNFAEFDKKYWYTKYVLNFLCERLVGEAKMTNNAAGRYKTGSAAESRNGEEGSEEDLLQ